MLLLGDISFLLDPDLMRLRLWVRPGDNVVGWGLPVAGSCWTAPPLFLDATERKETRLLIVEYLLSYLLS